MCAFTASRSEKMESHPVGGPGWHVLIRLSGTLVWGGSPLAN